jgi:hypothetical protein
MFQVTTLLPDPHAPVSKIPTIDGLPQVEEEKKVSKKQAKKDKKKAKKDGEGEQLKDGADVKTDE